MDRATVELIISNYLANQPLTAIQIISIVGSIAALILTIIQIYKFSLKSRVELSLPKEILFRLTEVYGETMFIYPLIAAYSEICEIRNVKIKLYTFDGNGNKQEIIVSPEEFGERMFDPQSIFPRTYYYSRSALNYVSPGNLLRNVYMCSVKTEDNTKVVEYFREFRKVINELLANYLKTGMPNKNDLDNTIKSLVDKTSREILNHLRINDGSYILELTLEYRRMNNFPIIDGKLIKSITKKLSFEIKDYKTLYTNSLDELLTQLAISILIPGENKDFVYPSIEPLNIKEIN